MIKFLFASGAVVYCDKHNATLSDILDCLEYLDIRHGFINLLSPQLKELLSNRIKKLSELDDLDSKENIKGNRDSKVEGVLDRSALLDSMSNHMELVLSKSPDDNINFVDAIREIKVIVYLLLNYLLSSGEFSYF